MDGVLIKAEVDTGSRSNPKITDVVVVCLKMSSLKLAKMDVRKFLSINTCKAVHGLNHLTSVTILISAPSITEIDREEIMTKWVAECNNYVPASPLPVFRPFVVSFEQLLHGYAPMIDAISFKKENEWPIIRRGINDKLDQFKDGVFVLSGWKGVGKTFTVKEAFPDALYLEL